MNRVLIGVFLYLTSAYVMSNCSVKCDAGCSGKAMINYGAKLSSEITKTSTAYKEAAVIANKIPAKLNQKYSKYIASLNLSITNPAGPVYGFQEAWRSFAENITSNITKATVTNDITAKARLSKLTAITEAKEMLADISRLEDTIYSNNNMSPSHLIYRMMAEDNVLTIGYEEEQNVFKGYLAGDYEQAKEYSDPAQPRGYIKNMESADAHNMRELFDDLNGTLNFSPNTMGSQSNGTSNALELDRKDDVNYFTANTIQDIMFSGMDFQGKNSTSKHAVTNHLSWTRRYLASSYLYEALAKNSAIIDVKDKLGDYHGYALIPDKASVQDILLSLAKSRSLPSYVEAINNTKYLGLLKEISILEAEEILLLHMLYEIRQKNIITKLAVASEH